MKLKLLFLPMVALSGLGASYALADGGHGNSHRWAGENARCQRAHLRGTIAGPATFTVTVAKSGPDGTFTSGQVVTVSLGTSGQPVRIEAGGCVSGSALSANEAELHAARPHGDQDQNGATTTANITAASPSNPGGVGGDGDHGDGHRGGPGRDDHQPPPTTASTTVATTTTIATTTVAR